MKKIFAILLASVMVLGLLAGCGAKQEAAAAGSSDGKIKIGISMPTYAEERWSVDEEAMKAKCAELGVECVSALAIIRRCL